MLLHMLSSRLQTFSYLKAYKLDKEFRSLNVNDNPTDLKNKLLNKLRNFNIFEAFYQIGLLYREMLKLNNDSDFMVFAHEFNFKNFTYLFKNTVIKYIEQTTNNTDLIDIINNDKIYLFNVADFQLFWINKMNFQISEIFETLKSNGGESIRTIIEKHSESNFHIEQWSNIVDRMFDLDYIKRNFNIED